MVATVGGVVLVALGVLAWGGQTISWLAPERAMEWSLVENEREVEPALWADIRGEARWDALSLWPIVVAGALLILGIDAWAFFGIVGGAVFVYFAGRGIATRREILRRNMRIGTAKSVQTAFVMLTVWGLMGAAALFAAVMALVG